MKNSTLQLVQMRILICCLTLCAEIALGGRMASCAETTRAGHFFFQITSDRVVNDMGEALFKFNPPDDVPVGAKVTYISYSIHIDDNGSELNFFPIDYEIWLSTESHGGYEYSCVYNNRGYAESNVDEGFDNDPENDTDIEFGIITNIFEGEDADQFYAVKVKDNLPGGTGKVTEISLTVNYEAPDLSNLDVDRTPPGWSAPIVVSSSSGSHTQAGIIYANTDYHLAFALYNSSDYAVSSNFVWEHTIAGHSTNLTVTYRIPAHELYPLHGTRQFEAGTCSICTRADPANTLPESDESDNEHCITINVIGASVAPALSSPADQATCQATDITFSWSTALYATSYNFQLDDDADFSSPVTNVDHASTSHSIVALSPGKKYYWRIRSYNPAGYGSYSATRSFTTSPGAPGIPSLSSPSNSAACQATSLKLNWQDASSASSYTLQLDNNSDFSSPLINESGIGISEYNVTGLSAGGTYYWRVSSSSGCKTSVWSSVYSFKVAETPAVPSLTSPAGAASCQPVSLTLSWNSVSGAASYDIVVDNNPDLGSPLVNQNVLTASYAVTGLSEGTTYYWAVRTKNSCGVYSEWSEPRPFTTLVPAATVPSPATPAHLANCQPLSLSLSWNEVAHASGYSIQVDNNDDFGSLVVNQTGIVSTAYTVSGLNPGTTYFWRVSATSACGGSSSWSSVRSFATASIPAIPTLAGPENAAVCQALNLTLSWNSVSGAVSFDIRVDDNSDFSSPAVSQTDVAATSSSVSGLNAGTAYYWEVRAKNNCGSYSAWSSVRNFTTAGNPSSPSLSNPSNSATCQSTSLTLSWNGVSGATSYDVRVDDNNDFSSPVISQTDIAATSVSTSGLSAGTTYYWAVRTRNGCDKYSSWTDSRSFTTAAAALSAPTPGSPANGDGCQALSVALSWNSISGATSYSLQVDNNDDFSSPIINKNDLASNEYTITGLSEGSTYYWRVSAGNACGAASSWSSSRNFTTSVTPSTPSLSEPANSATCQTVNLSLSWNSISGAVAYDIRIDDNSDFSSPVVNQTDVVTTASSVSGLNAGTTYNWAVRAKNSCGIYSSWSDSRSFVTAGNIPDAPGATTPADGASCQAVSITLDWSDVIGAGTYTLQVDDNSDFSSPLFNQGSLASTLQPVEGLSEGTNYFWRIKAVNSCGVEGPWSSGYSFTTLISSVATPVLTGPANSIECQPVNLTLSWENVPNATGYSLQVDNNSDFSSPDYLQSCAGNSHNCNNLAENTLYYWRVSASGSCSVTGSWSGVRSFKTGSAGMTAPLLTTPADSSAGEPLSLTLSWEIVPNATGYSFQLDDNEDFASPLYNEDLTVNSKEVSGLTEKTTYFWQVRANGTCSASKWSEVRQFETHIIPSAINREESNGYALKQNYPNPFAGITTVEFIIPVDCEVCIEFLNIQGMIIETYSGYYAAGAHDVKINLNDKAQAGVYIYRMRTSDFVDTKRCIFR